MKTVRASQLLAAISAVFVGIQADDASAANAGDLCSSNQAVKVFMQDARHYQTQCLSDGNLSTMMDINSIRLIKLQTSEKPPLPAPNASTVQFVGSGEAGVQFLSMDLGQTVNNDFSKSDGMTHLVFYNLHFKSPNVTLIAPNTLIQVQFIKCNVVDLNVVNTSGSLPPWFTDVMINQTNQPLQTMPRVVLEFAKQTPQIPLDNPMYKVSLTVDPLVTVPTPQDLELITSRWNNFKSEDGLGINLKPCAGAANNSSTQGPKSLGPLLRRLSDKYTAEICDEVTLATTTAPPTQTTKASRTSSGSSTTVIVIIALVCVGVGLAVFIAKKFLFKKSTFRRRRGRRHRGHRNGDNADVGLLDKDELPSCTLSFLLNDESLTMFRLPTASVTLGKPMGHRGYFMGEYEHQKVVLKRLEADAHDVSTRKRMESQLREIMPLEHANLIKIHGVTLVAGVDFTVVLEYAEKGNLKNLLLSKKQDFDVVTRVNMALDVASSVAFVHAQNLHFRCFNTQKVLVNESLICKTQVLCAFPNQQAGESEAATADRSYGVGTVPYIAPEVLVHWPGTTLVDLRKVDVYALGVILCEISTRQEPFQSLVNARGHTMTDLLLVETFKRQQVAGAPHEQHEEFMKMPVLFQDMVNSCLAMDPRNRPSAEDVVRCLQTIKNELVVLMAHESSGEVGDREVV